MGMTKREIEALECTLDALSKAVMFLDDPTIVIGRQYDANDPRTSIDYTRSKDAKDIDGACQHVAMINKHYGSDLVFVNTAYQYLSRFIQSQKEKKG